MITACGGSPTKPTDPPQISCPAAVSVVAQGDQPTVVSYPPPSVVGGQLPVTTLCNPASPASVSVGSTTVTCTATDARQRTAICTFTITVQPQPKLVATRFVAFGDSFTYGENGDALERWRLDIQVASPYPSLLRSELAARYTSQSVSVANEGRPGESLALIIPGGPGTAPSRFSQVLSSRQYDIALVLEGVNDLSNRDSRDIPPAIAALRGMVHDARSRSIRVMLATLPPMNPAGRRALAWSMVPQFNDQLKAMAASENVPFADLYQAFNGDFSLLNDDGLHPNDAGYKRIADTFFDAIKAKFEAPAPVTTSLTFAPAAAGRSVVVRTPRR